MALTTRGFNREGAATARNTAPLTQNSPSPEPAPARLQTVTTWESLTVATYRQISTPHIFEAWSTNFVLGTCPTCAGLNGQVWEEGTGSYPPVHPNCRCSRIYHHTEYEVRWEVEYRTTWEQIISMEWF